MTVYRPAGKFARRDGEMSFFAGARGQLLRIKVSHVGGIGFGPAGCGLFLHGDGKFRVSVAVAGEQTARIADRGLILAGGENSGGNLAVFYGEIAGTADGLRAVVGSDRGRLVDEAMHAAIFLRAGHGQERGIFGLAGGERKSAFDGGAQRIFIDAIGRRASGAAFEHGANRNREAVFGNILMNARCWRNGSARRRLHLRGLRFLPRRGISRDAAWCQ